MTGPYKFLHPCMVEANVKPFKVHSQKVSGIKSLSFKWVESTSPSEL